MTSEVPPTTAGRPPLSGRRLLTLMLLAACAWSIFVVGRPEPLLHAGGLAAARDFALALFRLDLSPAFLALALQASGTTLAYAFAGLTVAVGLGLPLGVIASGTLSRGRASRWAGMATARFVLGALRAIHELVWAWLFVAAVGLTPIAAVFALGLPYAGILGRIYAEQLQDVPAAPLVALRTTGASEWMIFLYGRFPMALPEMVSYVFYRLECAVRSAAIMSFVGLGGLGYQLQLSLGDLRYGEVWTLLLFLVAIIAAVDLWSMLTRRAMTR